MALPLDPLQNRLLAAMPAEDLRRWLPFLVPAGMLHYSRGQIGVLDRAGLERRACKCHAMIQQEYVRLLPARAEAATGRGSRAALPPWMTSMACTHAARTWPGSSVRQRTD